MSQSSVTAPRGIYESLANFVMSKYPTSANSCVRELAPELSRLNMTRTETLRTHQLDQLNTRATHLKTWAARRKTKDEVNAKDCWRGQREGARARLARARGGVEREGGAAQRVRAAYK